MILLSEIECHHPRKMIRRRLTNFFGSLLILLGLILLIPVAIVILLIMAAPNDLGDAWPTFLWMVPVFGLSATGVLIGGLRIKRKYRRLVLYLRRFGFADSAKALTFAVSTAIGKRWKLITLDDTKTAPVGMDRKSKRIYGIGKWILLLIVFAGLAYGFHLFYGGGLERLLDGVSQNLPEQPDNPDQGVIGNMISKLVTSIILTTVIGIFVLSIAVVGYLATALIIPLAFFTWGASRSVKKAEKRKAMTILTAGDLENARSKLVLKQHRIFSPRLVVVKVSNELWQKVVKAFAYDVDIILVDVSVSSDNLLWEINMLKEQSDLKWVFVGDHEYMLKMEQRKKTGLSDSEAQIRNLLANEEVLVYDETNIPLMKGFSRSLRNHLENKFLR